MWTITHSARYHHSGLDPSRQDDPWVIIEQAQTASAEEAEKWAADIAKHVIARDDDRYEGPGTPISTQLVIEWWDE